jgi:hypothetical protein
MPASIRLAAASNGSTNNPASVSMALLATDYLVVQLAVKDGSDPAIALVVPTVGGVSMTALGSEYTGTGGARRFTRLYGYAPPSDGTYTVSGSISDNFYFKGMQAFAWQGATASPISGIVGASNSGTDQTWTVTSAVGDVVAAHITSQNTNTVTAGSGSTLVSGSGLGAGQYETGLTEAGAASVTINGTTVSATDSWGLAYSVASAASAPTLTAPTGAATGKDAGSGTVSTTGANGLLWRKASVGTATDPGAGNEVANGWTSQAVSGSGAQTVTSFGTLTTGVAVNANYLHVDAGGQRSSVATSPSTFTPSTLAWAGTYSAQSCASGAAISFSGSVPTPTGGIGTKSYSATGLGASGIIMNSGTGQLTGTGGTVGSYTITPTVTDQSTAGSEIPQTEALASFNLTISAGGAATAVTNAGPSSGTAGSASTNFTAGANGTITGTVIVTPSDSGGGGAFTPSTVSISSGTPTATYTYTAGSAGVKSITVTNNGGLTNPSAISYTASAASGSFNLNNAIYAFKDNNGDLLASLGVTFWASNPTTGALVGAAVTGLSTNASGIVTTAVAPSGAVAGTTYRLNYKFASGEYGVVEMAAV